MLACILLTAFGIKLAEPELNVEPAVTQNVPADSWNSTDAGQAEPASAGSGLKVFGALLILALLISTTPGRTRLRWKTS